MNDKSILKRVLMTSFVSLFIFSIYAQIGPYEPSSGQAGKDVVWVPTSQVLVDKMLDMAQVKPGDYLMDLGSGDGRLVITAAKRGATATGVEYNPRMVKYSKEKAAEEGVSSKAHFVEADLFKTDLSKADVITLFLLTNLNLQLRPTLLNLKPGTHIVSNTFNMGDWEPDKEETVNNCGSGFCTALLWIVPAKVEGTWKLDNGKLVLQQKYQKVTGTWNNQKITEGHINGTTISFKVNKETYIGRIAENKIQGIIITNNGARKWMAAVQ
ncbi:MAG: class I SAM-dependent methyltransferase [Bacteroidetes bacterium]|nr:class I SAM-dependent methyltransferase [Bacteroidota bacterium]